MLLFSDVNPDLLHHFEAQCENFRRQLKEKTDECDKLKKKVDQLQDQVPRQQPFNVESVCKREKNIKNLFLYYTGLTYVQFLFLFSLLFPNLNEKLNFIRRDTKCFSNENALFLMLCRLRHDFGLKDMAVRFCLSSQSASVVFNTILDRMYFKFGQLSIWPHRD